jgi:glycerate kinase
VKAVVAPDKFKGCLGARDVAEAIAAGVRDAEPVAEIDLCPMADGGEGTVDALVAATGGRIITRRVTGPLPEMKVEAAFGVLGDGETAVVEMAAASGLHLLPVEQYDPMATTTFGTGELLMSAVEMGVKRIVLGIGGSATVDGGIGCAQACGLPVLLEGGEPVAMTEPLCGRDLESVVLVKHGRGSAIERVEIVVACDVTNLLYGENGAARVFGPQKGASPKDVEWFDRMLHRLAERTGKVEEATRPGAGAAGGLGFAMTAFFGARMRSGFEVVAEATRLNERLAGADLCITGEGRLDAQSLAGKTCVGVARTCKEVGVRCVALVGSVGEGAEKVLDEGVERCLVIGEGLSVEDSMRRAGGLPRGGGRKVVTEAPRARGG